MIHLPNKRLFLFDADGTLRRCTNPQKPCPNAPGEWELLPGVSALQRVAWGAGRTLGIVSNQGGIGHGFLTEQVALDLLRELVNTSTERPWHLWEDPLILICPHRPDAGCFCRKPWPTLLVKMMTLHDVTPAETIYIGDQHTDEEAAKAAGCNFMWADDFFERKPST
jgi:histidinol-phosphate phosphatase family protein